MKGSNHLGAAVGSDSQWKHSSTIWSRGFEHFVVEFAGAKSVDKSKKSKDMWRLDVGVDVAFKLSFLIVCHGLCSCVLRGVDCPVVVMVVLAWNDCLCCTSACLRCVGTYTACR